MTNLEIARESVRRRTERDVDAYVDLFTEDAVMDFSRSRAPWAGVYRGHEGLREIADLVLAPWESIEREETDVAEEGDAVVIGGHTTFHGRDGLVVEGRGAGLFRFRDGLIERYEQHQSFEDALAGLD